MGADLGLVGFADEELAELFADRSAGLTDPDDIPEALPEPVSISGDVWLLGQHRLVCGDSTDPSAVVQALNGAKPSLDGDRPALRRRATIRRGDTEPA